MDDYSVHVPLRDAGSAEQFESVLNDFLLELSNRPESELTFVWVKTQRKDGGWVKCVSFEAREHVLHFLAFWKKRDA